MNFPSAPSDYNNRAEAFQKGNLRDSSAVADDYKRSPEHRMGIAERCTARRFGGLLHDCEGGLAQSFGSDFGARQFGDMKRRLSLRGHGPHQGPLLRRIDREESFLRLEQFLSFGDG